MHPPTEADDPRAHDAPGEDAEWPYASLLILGYFGADTPAGKRLARRTTGFLLVFVVSMLGLRDGFEQLFPDLLWLLGLPFSVLGIWWAYARYMPTLDELSRVIQLRSFAVAYGAAMVLLAVGLAVAWINPTPRVPWQLLALPVFAEGARGMALAHFARRYR